MPAIVSKSLYRYMIDTHDFDSRVGFVYAYNYNGAMIQITKHYRDLNIRSITIEP